MHKDLSEEIEFVRKQMIELGKTFELNSKIVVEKSKHLDYLLNELGEQYISNYEVKKQVQEDIYYY